MSEKKEAKSESPGSKLKASAPAWTPSSASSASAVAAPPPPSAWGKKSNAVKVAAPISDDRTLPPKPVVKSQKPAGRHHSGGGRHSGGQHRGGRGGQRHGHKKSVSSHDNDNGQTENHYKVELWKNGEGGSEGAKGVKRISGKDLLDLRLKCMDPPDSWKSAEEGDLPVWRWVDNERKDEIKTKVEAPRMGGDAAPTRRKSNHKDTAPPLEECAPIQKNEKTRWKAKVMGAEEDEESDDVILKRALVCLNKLTLTKFEVVSDSFINAGIGRNRKCLSEAISLIVNKAQGEPHFAAMYANLCLKLAITPMAAIGEEAESKKGKIFKTLLLERCQAEFEQDTGERILAATKDLEDPAEKEYHASIIKKNYLGHMQFIGELYKGDLLSIKTMLFCLPILLGDDEDNPADVDEEKIECFTKLMSTVGARLEDHSEYFKRGGKPDRAVTLAKCWTRVEGIARKKDGYPVVSTRLRFMLQDLIDMKNKGWEARRKVETAKTLSQIHKEAAREESKMKRSSSNSSLRRSGSSNSLRGMSRNNSKLSRSVSAGPTVDEDGFITPVPAKKSIRRSYSDSKFSKVDNASLEPSKTSKFAALQEIEEGPKKVIVPDKIPTEKDIEKSIQSILKEYFVGGDSDDAVLSVKELIGNGDGVVERTSAVLSGGCLLIMEAKQTEVDKFISIVTRCIDEDVIAKDRVLAGLQRPLDVVSDIAVDAPFATSHLAQVVATCIKIVSIPFDFFLNTPEWFLTEGNAAKFGTMVLKILGDEAIGSQENIAVIEKLMTSRDKEKYKTVIELMAAC